MKRLDLENQEYIYIILTQTQTIPSKIIRMYTREPYAHASIALDIELKQMYSFARKRINNPFDCGFIYEDIEGGIFARDKDTKCNIYAIPVINEQYKRVVKEIEVFKKNQNKYSYSYLGIVGCMFDVPVIRADKFFCSQFVAYILNRSGIQLFHKSHALTRPMDIRLTLLPYKIYHGKLCKYRAVLEHKRVKSDHVKSQAV